MATHYAEDGPYAGWHIGLVQNCGECIAWQLMKAKWRPKRIDKRA